MEWANAAKRFVWHHLTYSIQRISLLSTFSSRLLALITVSVVHVGAGAVLYKTVSGGTWSHALFKSYGILFRAPGVAVVHESTWPAALVLNTIFVFGIFVFAVLIGMISDEIKQQVQAMRNGDVQLQLCGHVLVLNWNSITLSLLRQLCHAQHDRKHSLYKRTVVVLAERSKADMDAAVQAAMRGHRFEVFCISGRPSKQGDLQRVAAQDAGTVILLQPEPCSSDAAGEALKATALISLSCLHNTRSATHNAYTSLSRLSHIVTHVVTTMRRCLRLLTDALTVKQISRSSSSGRHSRQQPAGMHVVVQVPYAQPQDNDLVGFLHSTSTSSSSVQGARLLSQHMLDRLVAQTALQPGVAQAFREIVRAGADAAQLCWCDIDHQLLGTYKQARQRFPHAVVLGVLCAVSSQLKLNPADTVQLHAGDRLLGLTRLAVLQPRTKANSSKGSSVSTSGWRQLGRPLSRVSSMTSKHLHEVLSSSNITADSSTPSYMGPGRPMRVLVLGWHEVTVPDLLHSLQETAPDGSCFTFLHHSTPVQQQHGMAGGRYAPTPGTMMAHDSYTAIPVLELLTVTSQPTQAQQLQQQQQPPSPKGRSEIPGLSKGTTELNAATTDPRQLLQASCCQHMCFQQPCSVAALIAAGIADADAVIIGGALAPSGSAEADALVVAALLNVQQALETAGHTALPNSTNSCMEPNQESGVQQLLLQPARGQQQQHCARAARNSSSVSQLHVVAVLSSYSVRRAVQSFLSNMLGRCFSYEIMVLDEFAGAMLVQVAQDPANSLVMDAMMDASKTALYMWPADPLGFKYGSKISFGRVCKAARRQKCTALG